MTLLSSATEVPAALNRDLSHTFHTIENSFTVLSIKFLAFCFLPSFHSELHTIVKNKRWELVLNPLHSLHFLNLILSFSQTASKRTRGNSVELQRSRGEVQAGYSEKFLHWKGSWALEHASQGSDEVTITRNVKKILVGVALHDIV